MMKKLIPLLALLALAVGIGSASATCVLDSKLSGPASLAQIQACINAVGGGGSGGGPFTVVNATTSSTTLQGGNGATPNIFVSVQANTTLHLHGMSDGEQPFIIACQTGSNLFTVAWVDDDGDTPIAQATSSLPGLSTGSGPLGSACDVYQWQRIQSQAAIFNFAYKPNVPLNYAIQGTSVSFSNLTLTNPLPVSSGGTQCGAPSVFASLPVGVQGMECAITDAPACTPGTAITVGGGSTVCRAFYNGTSWFPAGGASASGGGGSSGAQQADVLLQNATVPVTNNLGKLMFGFGPMSATVTKALHTDIGAQGAVAAIGTNASSQLVAVLVYQGAATLAFDGATTTGDAFINSPTVDGSAHDTGILCTDAAGLSALTLVNAKPLLGCLTQTIGSSGNATVNMNVPRSSGANWGSCKAIPGGDITVAATGPGGSWTQVATCNIGPLGANPGGSNGAFKIKSGTVDMLFQTGAYPTSMEFELQSSCPTNNEDPHGKNPSYYAALGPTVGDRFPEEKFPDMLLTYAGGSNPFAATGACAVNIKARAAGNTFIVKAPAANGDSVSTGSAALIEWQSYR